MNGCIFQRRLCPENFAGKIQRGRAKVPEVNVQLILRHNRRGARGGVLFVNRLYGGRLRAKNLLVPHDGPIFGIEAKCVQRNRSTDRADRRCQIEFVFRQHRRRPALPRNLDFPCDILCRAPLHRHTFRVRQPLPGRPAKLRPILSGQPQRNSHCDQ